MIATKHDAVELDMDGTSADAFLGSLLDGLEDEELIDVVVGDVGIVKNGLNDLDLLSALEEADRAKAQQALYDSQESKEVLDATPPATTEELAESIKTTRSNKKASKKAKPVAIASAEPSDDKPLRATSVTHKSGDLLRLKLGADANDYLVLNTIADTEEAMTVGANAFIEKMNERDAIAEKVKEKISMLVMWVKHGGKLNEVMRRALTVLERDGEITSGSTGNLHLNLLSKPFSQGTAASQSNQIFMAFPLLELTIKEKGRMVPNPDSTLLPIVLKRLAEAAV